ncbi:MAG TPA: hypothetical protein VE258_09770, partial [Ktedonobacterales bacterium]|nr:hypothetical protein [Ktedonobacterales bacterium]
VVGWKGDLFPFKLNVSNILPIMSDRIHVPNRRQSAFPAKEGVIQSRFLAHVSFRRIFNFRMWTIWE